MPKSAGVGRGREVSHTVGTLLHTDEHSSIGRPNQSARQSVGLFSTPDSMYCIRFLPSVLTESQLGDE